MMLDSMQCRGTLAIMASVSLSPLSRAMQSQLRSQTLVNRRQMQGVVVPSWSIPEAMGGMARS